MIFNLEQAGKTTVSIYRDRPRIDMKKEFEMRGKLLTIKEISELTGWHKSTIYRKIKDKTFPAPVKYEFSSRWPEEIYLEWKNKPIEQQCE